MSISDQRLTSLEIVNEVRRKSKLGPVTSFTQDSFAKSALYYLNDVVSEVSDYGNWQETYVEVNVTAQSSVADYSIPVSAVTVVQDIHEVVFNNQPGEMRLVDLDTIRRLQRTRSFGTPQQWAPKGTDINGNPIISVSPVPVSAQSGLLFNIALYQKPVFITTAQVTAIPPFPGKLMVQGLLCKIILDESDGEPTARYQAEKQIYDDMLHESYNRYNGDTGSTIFFTPARGRR